MSALLLVGTGGIFGALTRYWLGKYIGSKYVSDFPYVTFFINISGSYVLAAIFFSPIFIRSINHDFINYFFLTGFLGAYTTFSTFSYEAYQLLKVQDYKNMVLYIIGTLVLGLVASYTGMLTARLF